MREYKVLTFGQLNRAVENDLEVLFCIDFLDPHDHGKNSSDRMSASDALSTLEFDFGMMDYLFEESDKDPCEIECDEITIKICAVP